jgi:uncharacterized protein (DUF4415 family)
MRKGRSGSASNDVGELPPELLAELRAAAALPDEEINTDDVPEVTDWSQGERGRFYRPVKRQVTLRIDADVLAFFRATEKHYQTAMNRTLRAAMLRGLRRRKGAAAG